MRKVRASLGVVIAAILFLAACGHSSPVDRCGAGRLGCAAGPAFPPAPPADTTGGFDGARAYKHVEQLVAIGPHSAGTEGIRRAQAYIIGQLKSFGCAVEEQDFHADTPSATWP